MTHRACDTCGFLPTDYAERDLVRAPSWLLGIEAEMLEGVSPVVLADPAIAGSRASLATTGNAIDPAHPDPDLVHDGIHLLRGLSRLLHDLGAGAPTQAGTVHQINTSDGGVPKSAVASVDIGPRGLLGDRQADRKHHGRPFQAVCLWSADVIDALRAEGHPVRPGSAGENITVAGIDWAAVRPGARLLVGQVLLELSAWAEPCRKNDQWFVDSSHRIDHRLHPGWSRVYAWVLEPGAVLAGDPVIVEP